MAGTKALAEASPTGHRLSERERFQRRKTALFTERSTWEPDYREIRDYLAPFAGRFDGDAKPNDGDKVSRTRKVHDNKQNRSLRVLGAGMQGGLSSQARPWFKLSSGDKEKDRIYRVKVWLEAVQTKMRAVFSASNTYRSLFQVYIELGAFGTAACVMVEDYEDVIHLMPLTVGEYAIATDGKGRVCTLVRELKMTVAQLVDEFGYARCSDHVKNHYDNDNLDLWISLVHVIEPRKVRDTAKMDQRNKRWKSVYFEVGSHCVHHGGLLREGGFDEFNVLAPRWEVNGSSDVYGTGPGHEALPAIRELQHSQLRRGQVIDYQIIPPLQIPASLKNVGVNRLPGGETFVPDTKDNAIKSLYDVKLNTSDLREDIQDVRQQIAQIFFEDLFLMIASEDRSGVTATEIAQKHEEKLLMLGPVTERLQNELFKPLIDFTFARLQKAGALPPPPPELQDQDLKVEYIGLLAQAQKLVGLRNDDRFVATIGAIASGQQASGQPVNAWDVLDADVFLDEYADTLGVEPTKLTSPEVRQALRQGRAQQAAAAQATAAAEQVAGAAQTASQIDTENLPDVMGMLSGYSNPTPQEAA